MWLAAADANDFRLPLDARAFLGNQDLVADAEAVGFGEQALDRFVMRFVA
jgi:hypothetical protein